MNYRAKPKVSLKPFQRLAESRDSVSGGSRAAPLWVLRAKPLGTKCALQGDEFQNSPVGCFERGEALQERASPCSVPCLYARGIIPRMKTLSFVCGRTECAPTSRAIQKAPRISGSFFYSYEQSVLFQNYFSASFVRYS